MRVMTELGYEFVGLEDVCVHSWEGFDSVRTQDLRKGQMVVVSAGKVPEKLELDSEAYYVGFALGDGSCTVKTRYMLRLCGTREHLEQVLTLKSFGDEKWDQNQRGVWQVRSRKAREWWVARGMKLAAAWEKEIPDWIMKGTSNQKWSCLCGLIDTDGCVQYVNNGHHSFSTSSGEMARQVQALSRDIGLFTRRRLSKVRKGDRPMWWVGYSPYHLWRFGRPLTVVKEAIPVGELRLSVQARSSWNWTKDKQWVQVMEDWGRRCFRLRTRTRDHKQEYDMFYKAKQKLKMWVPSNVQWLMVNSLTKDGLMVEEQRFLESYFLRVETSVVLIEGVSHA